MFIEIKMCNKLCFSTKPVKCRLEICVFTGQSDTWYATVHLFGVTQVQVGGEIFTWGKKGCEQSNLESLATQGHFDQKFESHQKKEARPVW